MIRFDHIGDCTFPTSGTCTCGATLPLAGAAWMDTPYHPYVRGRSHRDATGYRRVGPRGGLHPMSNNRREDRESLMCCAQVVVRGRESVLALCNRPRYQHEQEREDIR